tara:strand:- start:250 stop:444 length:195 start_codon:yes stop_codon:yes gene_type:complete
VTDLKGIIPVSLVIGVLHLFEDAALILIGRYTELNVFIVLLGTVIFSVVVAYVTKIPFVHKFFH